MRFLIKAAFWLSLVILILPADPDHETGTAQLSTVEAFFAAKAAISDVSSFCARQPNVCAAGEVAFDQFAAKARYGAKQIYVYLDGEPEGVAGNAPDGAPSSVAQNSVAANSASDTNVAQLSQAQARQASPTLAQDQLTAMVQKLQ